MTPNLRIRVDAGKHDRQERPISFKPTPRLDSATNYQLVSEGNLFPVQLDESKNACFLAPPMLAGESMELTLEEASEIATGIEASLSDHKIDIVLKNQFFTSYHFKDVKARPYFFPVLAPGQTPVTRSFPMIETVPGETKDHPHHRSLWIAYGEANGTDNWSEDERHGFTEHQKFDSILSGPVFGGFSETSLWTDSQRQPILTQKLKAVFWATSGRSRIADFEIDFSATHGDVYFGDTKEGGIISIRVASELDAPRTGRITNSFGAIGEEEAWGKSAHWCDFSGSVEGKEVGLAVLDHPLSFRYPTHWHVRNYGLMTANPFGYSHYTGGVKKGDHTLLSGETLSFRYRLILHEGDAEKAKLVSHYLSYSAPVKPIEI